MVRQSFSVEDAIRESGKKLTRSELRGYLSDRGLSRDDAATLLEQHGNVGSKAQTFYDRSGESESEPRERMRTMKLTGSPGQRLFLTDDGSRVAIEDDMKEYLDRDGFSGQYEGYNGGRNLLANNKSGRKLNDWLDEKGYSLKGGKGMELVGTRRVTVDSGSYNTIGPGGVSVSNRPWNASVHTGQHKEYVPVYRQVKEEKPEEEPAEEVTASEPSPEPPKVASHFANGEFDTSPLMSGNAGQTAFGGEDGAEATPPAGSFINTDWFGTNPLGSSASSSSSTSSGTSSSSSSPRPASSSSTGSSSAGQSLGWANAWDENAPSWRDDSADDEGAAFAGSRGFRERLSRMALA